MKTMKPSRDELRKLSIEQRLELVEEIWETIDEDSGEEPISEELKRELDRRWAEYERDPSTAREWQRVKRSRDERS